jgi:hypothetical protein
MAREHGEDLAGHPGAKARDAAALDGDHLLCVPGRTTTRRGPGRPGDDLGLLAAHHVGQAVGARVFQAVTKMEGAEVGLGHAPQGAGEGGGNRPGRRYRGIRASPAGW